MFQWLMPREEEDEELQTSVVQQHLLQNAVCGPPIVIYWYIFDIYDLVESIKNLEKRNKIKYLSLKWSQKQIRQNNNISLVP